MQRSALQWAAWGVAAILAALAAFELLGRDGGAPAAPVRLGRGAAGRAEATRPGLYVHVAGAVRRPGVYRLPAAARVAVAIRRAGGSARGADLTAINLAARLQDGQQVVVPRAGQGGAAGVGGAGQKPGLGSATVEQLDELDGIGPKLAERIVEYRRAHGGFRSLEQLREVDGIGEKRLEALKEALQP